MRGDKGRAVDNARPIATPHASSYAGALSAVAALTASGAILLLLLISHGDAISLRPAPLPATPTGAVPWLAALIGLALAAALLSTVLAGLLIRAIRIFSYSHAMRAYCQQELTRAGISRTRDLIPIRLASAPNALTRLDGMRRALALGTVGGGKTTLLMALARRGAAPLASLAATLGLRRIPALISLSGLAATIEAGGTAEAYLAAQFARLGSNGLAARASRMLTHGGLTLLCDDYDALDPTGRDLVNTALLVWTSAPNQRCQIIIVRDDAYVDQNQLSPSPLDAFPIERLQPLTARVLTRLLHSVVTPGGKVTAGPSALSVTSLMNPASATLRANLPVPAVARAFAAVVAHDHMPPVAYSAAMRRWLLLKRDAARAESEDAQRDLDPALIWGAIGASLQGEGRAAVPLDATRPMGECAAAWLTAHPPLMPVSFALQADLEFDANALEYGIKAGVEAGVLRRQVDGLGLAFAHSNLRLVAAAYWLDAMDNGLGRLNSALLTPAWVAPVVFWASARPEAMDVAPRLYRLTQSPDSVASRAGLARSSDVAPVALALALIAAIEGAEPLLISPAGNDPADYRLRFAIQQQLRDLLDAAAIMAADQMRQAALALALRQARARTQAALEASARALMRLERLDRLARAQLALALGLLGTTEAIEELIQQINQSDYTIRQAVRQALTYAGSDAIGVARSLAASAYPETSRRASEALALLSAAIPEASESASEAALSGLASADALQRRAAATTLGAVRASVALDALIARLDDTHLEVQGAAASALGRLGAPAGLAALRKRASAASPALRRTVAEALGEVSDPLSRPVLLGLLRDREAAVRAAAATALGAQRDPLAAGPLREAAGDPNPLVRRAAQAAAQRLTGA